MKTKTFLLSIPVVFFLYLFLIYNPDFRGPDEPIYFAYTASVAEDGDLNAVNQAYPKSAQLRVSKTYNLPDFHNHGGVILWVPFYAYGKAVYSLASRLNLKALAAYGPEKLTRCALSLSTVFFGFLTLIFTYLLARAFFSKPISLWSTLAIFFGTPFFYYTLFETGNANIIASLFSVLSIWFLSYAISMKRPHWFLYGLFFSICVTIKTDLWFQAIFILAFFISLLKMQKTTWANGGYFLAGLLPGMILKIINDYIKYGTFHEGHFSLVNFKTFYFFEQLFSSYQPMRR